MGKYIDKHSLPRLTQKVIEKSQHIVSIKEIKSSITNITTKKTPGKDDVLANSPKYLKKNNVNLT